MQARMSSVRPCSAFEGISGSQIIARVMPQASASPRARIASAICGWLIRPVTITGLLTAFFTAAANGAVYPCVSAIGGTMWMAPAKDADVPATTWK
jgi:hypothetical protein